jgi:hypothetical protein
VSTAASTQPTLSLTAVYVCSVPLILLLPTGSTFRPRLPHRLAGELNGSTVQYAYVRVQDTNSKLNKFVIINWSPDGASGDMLSKVPRHSIDVKKLFGASHGR